MRLTQEKFKGISVFIERNARALDLNLYRFYFENGSADSVIADRTLLEFFRAYTGPLKQSIEDTLEIVRYYQNSAQFTILTATEHTNQLTFELAEQAEAKSGKIFDLNILAMAIENEIDILLTKNVSDYPQTGLINIVDPT